MPKGEARGPKGKSQPKSAEKSLKNSDKRETRSRSRSAMETTNVAINKRNANTPGSEPRAKRSKSNSPGSNKKNRTAKRKIQFDKSDGTDMSATRSCVNNNATLRTGKLSKPAPSKQHGESSGENHAVSDPTVVDMSDDYNGDGVDVELHPNANQSDFDSESDYEQESSETEDTARGCQGNENKNEDEQIEQLPHGMVLDEVGDFDSLFENEKMKRLFNKMLDQRVEAKLQEHNLTGHGSKGKSVGKCNETGKETNANNMDKTKLGNKAARQVNNASSRVIRNSPLTKSPPDTTLYAPTVRKAGGGDTRVGVSPGVRLLPPLQMELAKTMGGVTEGKEQEVTEISNFVESIRMTDTREEVRSKPAVDMDETPGFLEAKSRAEKAILDAKRFKVAITEPPDTGKMINNANVSNPVNRINFMGSPPNIGEGLTDDDFFHLTCHVDSGLIAKIEKGEFVELEKLLPKDKRRKLDDNRMEWVRQEGSTFLAPVSDRMNKISSFQRWDQAFQVYATIYCGANPARSKEIWQYMSVINTAATNFVWDNVYEYNLTFRHLMAFNPNRSWAVTYNQMWNLCMKEALPPRNVFQGRVSSGGNNNNNFGRNHQGGSGNRRRKSDYCWNFNKGIACKYGKKCRFIERCSYCDADSHGVVKCPKLEKKGGEEKL